MKLVGSRFMVRNVPYEVISMTDDQEYCSIKNVQTGQEQHMVRITKDEDMDLREIPVKVDNASIGVFTRDGELVMANVAQTK